MPSAEIVLSSFFQLVFFSTVELNQVFSRKSDAIVDLTTAVFLEWLIVDVSLLR